jgi:Cd2+/Zn2+-exporting ATPase/Cu+-exporting ATPase
MHSIISGTIAQVTTLRILEVPISGMDCAECTQHVRHAIVSLPGVASAEVLLASEKAIVQLDPARVNLESIRQAVHRAGYSVPQAEVEQPSPGGGSVDARLAAAADLGRRATALLAAVFGVVLFVVVAGEWFGLFEHLTARVPFAVGLVIVAISGWPIFVNVIRAASRGQIIAHTLMSLGVLAALAVGQWATAVVVVFFMRAGDRAERFTTESARKAVQDLTRLAPQTARVERDGAEIEVAVAEVKPGEVVVVRPGERIPVDGEVITGHASVDRATLTGESLPMETGPGSRVLAATIPLMGALRVRVLHTGQDTTFGRVIRLVEQAEAHRSNVQRLADRFTGWYLPVVAGVAGLTLLLRRDPLAAAAVLVVACSCSIALATPIAMLASVGAAARRGLLIKGGKHLETLARADVLLIDKTGTLTLGQPAVTDILPNLPPFGHPMSSLQSPISNNEGDRRPEIGDSSSRDRLLTLAASAERYSEHPLARAVLAAARSQGLALAEPEHFEALTGIGVRATVNGNLVEVTGQHGLATARADPPDHQIEALASQGKSLIYVLVDQDPAGVIAVADRLRPEARAALAQVQSLGIRHVELLTGDNESSAAQLASELGIRFRASLMPEDKIDVVKAYQAQGHVVVMVGDGVNDAPALAQADVGIAMGVAGSDIALEAAHIGLMRDDWLLVPEAIRLARRTMGVVQMNLAFTALYNLAGLTLAALGLLPPIFAAVAQSLPDLGILANSSRLLRQRSR